MAWFNKYAYSDFHELSLDYVLSKITDFDTRLSAVETQVQGHETRIVSLEGRTTSLETRMNAAEGDIDALETRMGTAESDIDALETRMGAAESDIDALETRMGAAESDIDALESADIQNAEMLADVTGVVQSATNVTINIKKDVYTNGAKSSESDNAVVPAATTSAAGVMVPGDKAKLEPISVNGDDLTVAGAITLGATNTNNDAVTKGYVDNLVISGGVSTTEAAINWDTSRGTISAPALVNKIYRYGNVRALRFNVGVDSITNAILDSQVVAFFDLAAGDVPPVNIDNTNMTATNNDRFGFTINSNGRVQVTNRSGATYAVGTSTPS
ncbi:MAG: hypothetical protein J6S12_01960, partial [Alphaproteobacteria bacterium]|nr:hypothetical protein [Alphaproteobacteria bacterium]